VAVIIYLGAFIYVGATHTLLPTAGSRATGPVRGLGYSCGASRHRTDHPAEYRSRWKLVRRAACHFSDVEKVQAYPQEYPEQANKGINEAVRFEKRGSEISTTSRSAGC
jgi:hypothetical protein